MELEQKKKTIDNDVENDKIALILMKRSPFEHNVVAR